MHHNETRHLEPVSPCGSHMNSVMIHFVSVFLDRRASFAISEQDNTFTQGETPHVPYKRQLISFETFVPFLMDFGLSFNRTRATQCKAPNSTEPPYWAAPLYHQSCTRLS